MNSKIILLASLCAWHGLGCGQDKPPGPVTGAAGAVPGQREIEPNLFLLGRLNHPQLMESSGVVASRQYPDVLWTHSDGGGGRKQTLYAVDRTGRTLGEFLFSAARLTDWEDIAIDEQNFLYVGDLGNNEGRRRELTVYRVDEPNPTNKVGLVNARTSWRLHYPGAPFDCESLFIWKNHGYVVSKVVNDARAQIYSFPLDETKEPVVLSLVATTKIESPVAGADISPDGRLLALIAKSGAFVYRIDGDPSRANKHKPFQHKIKNSRAEGCTFVPDGLLVTAESREIFLFADPAFLWQSTAPTLTPTPAAIPDGATP